MECEVMTKQTENVVGGRLVYHEDLDGGGSCDKFYLVALQKLERRSFYK